MTPRIPTAGQVCGTLALAAFFWWVNFGLHWVNFWIGMGTAASVLALLSFWFAGVPMKRTEWTGRAVLIGLVSAVLLYAIFALGNTLSGWLFRFAPHQVSAIYDIRHEGSPLAMALVLLFITSPAEEVFWRGFVQRWFMHRFGGKAGWLLAVCVYAGGPRFFREPHAGHGRPDGGAVLGLALLENRQPRPLHPFPCFLDGRRVHPLAPDAGRLRGPEKGVAHKKGGEQPRLLVPFVYSALSSILMPTTMSRRAKHFLSLGTGRVWARRAPSGAVNMLTMTMPNRLGR